MAVHLINGVTNLQHNSIDNVLPFYNIHDDVLKCINSVLDDNTYPLIIYVNNAQLSIFNHITFRNTTGVILKMKLTLTIISVAIFIQNVITIQKTNVLPVKRRRQVCH